MITAEEFLGGPQSQSAEAFLMEDGSASEATAGKPNAAAFLEGDELFTATDSPPASGRGAAQRQIEREGFSEAAYPDGAGANFGEGFTALPADAALQGERAGLLTRPTLPEVPKVSGARARQALPQLPPKTMALGTPLGAVVLPSAEALAGAERVGGGFVDFLSSPLGLAGMVAGPAGLGRAAAAGFAADMIRQEPALARRAGAASVSGDEGEQVEAGLGLAANTLMAGAAAGGAVLGGGRGIEQKITKETKGEVPVEAVNPEVAAELDRIEGGGLSQTGTDPTSIPTRDVQTSGVLSAEGYLEAGEEPGVARLREELAALNDAPGAKETKGAVAAIERAPDVLDWIEGRGVALRRLERGESSDLEEPWRRAQKAEPDAFAPAGLNPDDVAELYRRETGKEISDEDFLAAVGGARSAREAMAAGVKQEFGRASQDANWQSEGVSGARGRGQGTRVEPVGAEELAAGDKFTVSGEKVVVERVKARPDDETMVESVVVKDGPKFGTQVVRGDETLRIDEGSLERGNLTEGHEGREGGTGMEQWAEWVIEGAKGRVSSGIDPELLAAYAVKGAAILARGVKDFEEWSREMLREFGATVRAHLQTLWERAKWETPLTQDVDPKLYGELMGMRDDLIGGFKAPEGWSLKDIQTSTWKSVYYILEDAEGEPVKIRIANHDSKRTAHGPNDYEITLDKDFTLHQFEQAVRRAEAWAEKKAQPDEGLGGIKPKSEDQAQMPPDKSEDTHSVGPRSAADSRNIGERRFPKQVDISSDVSDAVKLGQGPRLYEVITDAQAAARARGIIESVGLDSAAELAMDRRSALPGKMRVALGIAVMKKYGELERVAELSKDAAGREAAIAAQLRVDESLITESTDAAQTVQAFHLMSYLTPAAQLGKMRRVIESAREAGIGAAKPGLENIKETLGQVNEAVAGEVVNDPAVVKAAEPALEPMAQQVATSVAGQRVLQIWDSMWKEAQTWSEAIARAGIRAHEIARDHFAGVDLARTLGQKLRDELHIKAKEAEGMARVLEREFGKLVAAEAKKLMSEARRAVWAKRHGELLAMAKEHFGESSGVQVGSRGRSPSRELWEKVRDILKVDEKTAREFAEKLTKRFADLATERKRAALRRLSLPARVGPTLARGLHERLIELSNIGALDDAAFDRVVAEKLGLPQWSRDLAEEVKRRAEGMQRLPEGSFLRRRESVKLLNYIAKAKGVTWYDLPMAFWYANAMSGPLTHVVNAASNGVMLAGNVGYTMLRTRPEGWAGLYASVWRGLGKGSIEAAELMRTGLLDGSRLAKVEAMSPLELAEFRGVAAPLKLWRYVGRAMGGSDLIFYKGAEELKAYSAAREIAAREGLSGEGLERRVAEVLGRTEEQVAAARAGADATVNVDGSALSPRDWQRRVDELLEEQRPEMLRENAKEYALRSTFNQEPYGVLGEVYRSMADLRRRVPAMRLVLPFMRIAANLTNEGLNYLPPVGHWRAWRGTWSGEFEGKPITDRTVLFDQWAKASVGLLGLAALYELHAAGKIELTGAGPMTGNQRRELEETGWRPYSIKVGDKWYGYGWTPFAIPVSILANYVDAQRFRKLDEEEAVNRAAYAWEVSGQVILQQSFLSGLNDLLKVADNSSPKNAANAAGKWATKSLSTFVVPNAVRFVDQVFDPTVYEANTIEGQVVASAPFARRLNRPAINALGEPVQKFASDRFVSGERGNVLWDVLAAKQAWVSVPERDVVVGGSRKDGPGFYRTLNDAEFYRYVLESGRAIREELLQRLPELQQATPEEARELVRSVTVKARDEARKGF